MSQATSNFILTGDSTDAVRAFRRAGEEYQRLLRQVRSAGVPKTGAGLPDRRTKQYKAIDMTSPPTPAEKRQVEDLMKQQGFDQDVISQTGMEGLNAKNQVASMKEVGVSYSDLQTKAASLEKETNLLTQRHEDLGKQSGLNTSQVYKQRQAIDSLLKTEGVATAIGERRTATLRSQSVALKDVEKEVTALNNRMTFMNGASIQTQDNIRNAGAAAQGAMLGLSAMNGDVMGLAFSLIFLQFSANIPVTASFVAMSLAAAFALKGIKKIIKERREMKLLGNAFFIVTRSMESLGVARERAEGISGDLGLKTKDEEELTKALLQAQLLLRQQGIEPTSEALKVAAAAFLVTQASMNDYDKSLQAALDSTKNFADSGIPMIGDASMSMAELEKQGSSAVKMLQDFGETGNITFGQLKDLAKDAGVAWNPLIDALDPDAWIKELDDEILTSIINNKGKLPAHLADESNAVFLAKEILKEVLAVNPQIATSLSRTEDIFNEAFDIVKPLGEDNSQVGLAFSNFNRNMKNAFESNDPIREMQLLANQAAMTANSRGMNALQRKFEDLALKAENVATATTNIRNALTDETLNQYLDSLVGWYDIQSMQHGFTGEQEGGPFRHGYGGVQVNVYDNVVRSETELATIVSNKISQNTNVNYGGRL